MWQKPAFLTNFTPPPTILFFQQLCDHCFVWRERNWSVLFLSLMSHLFSLHWNNILLTLYLACMQSFMWFVVYVYQFMYHYPQILLCSCFCKVHGVFLCLFQTSCHCWSKLYGYTLYFFFNKPSESLCFHKTFNPLRWFNCRCKSCDQNIRSVTAKWW